MASDFARLMKQDFSDFEGAAKAWEKLGGTMESLQQRHRRNVTGPLHAQWKGKDADSALFYLEDVESRIGIARTEAVTIAEVMDETRFRMEQAQNALRNAVRRAEENGYAVDDEGNVTDTSLPTDQGARHDPDYQDLVRERSGPLGEYRQWIDQALKDAREASDQGTKALSGLNGDIMDRFRPGAVDESGDDAKAAMKALGIQGPQIPDKPQDAADWWKALSPAEQREYMTMYPKEIGSTNGLPSFVRNEANRIALDQEYDALVNGDARAENPGASNDELNNRQSHLALLRDELEKNDGQTEERKQLYLLDFDGSGNGRAVIAMGNPDTAAHTAIQVPGTDTTMESVPGQLGRIGDLQDSAYADGKPNGDVSTIFWLGYDAPEFEGGTGLVGGGVTSEDRAEEAAPRLRDFVQGTRASHEGEPSHVTVLGHSYGSTVVGNAASMDGGLGADDIVAVGSPGMGVNKAEDLNIDPDHVWIGTSQGDGVANGFADFNLGDNPTEEPFGGNNFKVDHNGGHSDYWKGDALTNQGLIIAGKTPETEPKQDNDIPMVPW